MTSEIERDFATTPTWATNYLLDMEPFSNTVYEPCCGTGAISKVFWNNGYTVISTDIVDRGYGNVADVFDLEKINGDVITNPPFSKYSKIKNHLIDVTSGKVALLSFARNLGRDVENKYGKTLKNVYILGKLDFPEIKLGWQFAWFVWEKGYRGEIAVVKEPDEYTKNLYKNL